MSRHRINFRKESLQKERLEQRQFKRLIKQEKLLLNSSYYKNERKEGAPLLLTLENKSYNEFSRSIRNFRRCGNVQLLFFVSLATLIALSDVMEIGADIYIPDTPLNILNITDRLSQPIPHRIVSHNDFPAPVKRTFNFGRQVKYQTAKENLLPISTPQDYFLEVKTALLIPDIAPQILASMQRLPVIIEKARMLDPLNKMAIDSFLMRKGAAIKVLTNSTEFGWEQHVIAMFNSYSGVTPTISIQEKDVLLFDVSKESSATSSIVTSFAHEAIHNLASLVNPHLSSTLEFTDLIKRCRSNYTEMDRAIASAKPTQDQRRWVDVVRDHFPKKLFSYFIPDGLVNLLSPFEGGTFDVEVMRSAEFIKSFTESAQPYLNLTTPGEAETICKQYLIHIADHIHESYGSTIHIENINRNLLSFAASTPEKGFMAFRKDTEIALDLYRPQQVAEENLARFMSNYGADFTRRTCPELYHYSSGFASRMV